MTRMEGRLTDDGGILLLLAIIFVFNLLSILGLGLADLTLLLSNPNVMLIFLSACCLALGIYGIYILNRVLVRKNRVQKYSSIWIYCSCAVSILNVSYIFFVFNELKFVPIVIPTLTVCIWLTSLSKFKRMLSHLDEGIEDVK